MLATIPTSSGDVLVNPAHVVKLVSESSNRTGVQTSDGGYFVSTSEPAAVSALLFPEEPEPEPEPE